MTSRAFYSDTVDAFLVRSLDEIIGRLTQASPFAVEPTQRDAWLEQIRILRDVLHPFCGAGKVYFEYAVPRMGKRIDVVLVLRQVLFVIEFKVGETEFTSSARDQVWDYALDLKHFHKTSHYIPMAPVLVATRAAARGEAIPLQSHNDRLIRPLLAAPSELPRILAAVLSGTTGECIDAGQWEQGGYSPTPTIIEAAVALYGGHAVEEISRNDASAINLTRTSATVGEIIRSTRESGHKSLCFVTGVPGAGKTLVGLNIATQHSKQEDSLYSVFLSGNGPLVAILRESLARDKVRRERQAGRRCSLKDARREVEAFVQNVHHFRDDCLVDPSRPPPEHVALFDEAQRAWNRKQTESFMKRKKGRPGFDRSEPEFLISCMDRHADWAVVVCLVGGGQEINTGEAGIGEWAESIIRSFPHWRVYMSPRLSDSEYGAGDVLMRLRQHCTVQTDESLHLAVSMRSFRAEHVSGFVKALLDRQERAARDLFEEVSQQYPIVITRNAQHARAWLRSRARGSERYGLVASSQAQRLKPLAIDVRAPMDPVHWFLDPKPDVRSSYYLEDVATEFHVQGLELDWVGLVWDADFRVQGDGWGHYSFIGDRWNRINSPDRQAFLKNAYRVLLTRARQGMVIVVPEGDPHDPTRAPSLYDPVYDYLRRIGIPVLLMP